MKQSIVAACYPASATDSSEKRLWLKIAEPWQMGPETVTSASVQMWVKLVVTRHGVVSKSPADDEARGARRENLTPPGSPGFSLF